MKISPNLRWLPAVVLSLTLTGISTAAHARTAPIYNVMDKIVHTASGADLSAEEIGNILRNAATYKRWSVTSVEDGYLKAEIQVRQHFAAIDIRYSATTYSIIYRDSKALQYDGTKIHRNYNKWIQLIEQKVAQDLSNL